MRETGRAVGDFKEKFAWCRKRRHIAFDQGVT
jgi:hypothetical protein